MRFVFGGLMLLFSVFCALVATGHATAAVTNFSYNQACSNGKANVTMMWQNVAPNATELWVDMSTRNDFSENLESRGPLGRVPSYQWNGLEPHSIYYVRVNQKLASGDWDASGVGRVATACGTATAAAGSTFTVRGFSDNVGPQNAAPAELTPEGGSFKGCASPRLYVFMRYTGLDDLTDFIVTWSGPGIDRNFAWALPKGDGPAFFVTNAPAGGFQAGSYGFKFTSGGEASPVVHVDSKVDLTC